MIWKVIQRSNNLRAEVAGLSDTVGAQDETLGGLQGTADETHDTIKDILSELRSLMGSPPCRHPGRGGVRRGHTPKSQPEAVAPKVPLPLFGKEISMGLHESGLATLGMRANRGSAVVLTQAVKDASEKMPFAVWWGALQKSKSINQWRAKLVMLGAQEADAMNLNFKQIGEFMIRRITVEGTVADKSVQAISIP